MKILAMVWQLDLCGTATALADICDTYGIAGVTIKVLNSYNKFNAKNGDGPLIDYITTLRTRGLIVEGWGYHYPGTAELQGKAIAERYETLALDGYQINVEAQYKAAGEVKSAAAFKTMADQLLPHSATVCSYRFPTIHSEMPWKAMSKHSSVSGWTPQVYWALSHNAVEQLEQCLAEYDAIDDQPVYPVGPTFGQSFKLGDTKVYWTPEIDELIDFRVACEEAGIPRIYYFRLDQVIQKGWWDMLTAATGVYMPLPEPEPEPEPEPVEKLLFRTLVEGQSIRSEPSTARGSRTVIMRASTEQILGPILDVHIESRNEVWFEFAEGWMAAVHGGRQYLTEI